MKIKQNKTPDFIKECFKLLRKNYDIKIYVSNKRDMNKIDMSICSRPYGDDFYIDFPMSSDGWGEIIKKMLIDSGAEDEGFRVEWSGYKENSIKLKKINDLEEKEIKDYENFKKLKELKENDFGLNI